MTRATLPLRTLLVAAALAAYLAVGPVALAAAVAVVTGLLVARRTRARVLPRWRHVPVAAGVVAAGVATVLLVPDGRLPIPPGGGLLVTPSYVGGPATPHPLELSVPQHPGLAANGRSAMHDDAWSTDAYAGPGPLGVDPEVDTSWFGVEECATLAFDREARLVALCGRISGPVLHVLDPETMDPLDTLVLPEAHPQEGKRRWEDLCGGSYFYLDATDRAFVGTTERSIAVVTTAAADGGPDLRLERTVDLTGVIPDDDCLVALMPTWDGAGTWWVTQDGRVGLVGAAGAGDDPGIEVLDLGEEVANSISVDRTGLYVVTVAALYQLQAGPGGVPAVGWRAAYENSGVREPGQLSAGSGTTPTILPSGLVAITDNADPAMHVQLYDLADGELACEAPVFEDRPGATENSLVAVGDAAVVVENNHGYRSPLSTMLGRTPPGGLARVDATRDGDGWTCEVTWTSDVVAPTSVAKVSLETGLVYAYATRPSRWGVQAWYVAALDAATGEQVFAVRTGTGTLFNNHYAAVTLAPDGSLYVATLAGMVRLRDG